MPKPTPMNRRYCVRCGRNIEGEKVSRKGLCQRCVFAIACDAPRWHTDEHGEKIGYCAGCGKVLPLKQLSRSGFCVTCIVEWVKGVLAK